MWGPMGGGGCAEVLDLLQLLQDRQLLALSLVLRMGDGWE
jgi:hypothetical protein